MERSPETGVAESAYTPNAALTAGLDRVAALVGGRVYDEANAGEAGDAVEKLAGNGETRGRAIAGSRLALMPYVTLVAFLPLLFLLWRRNR